MRIRLKGLKPRLAVSFILIIVIPIVFTLILLSVQLGSFDGEEYDTTKIQPIIDSFKQKIKHNETWIKEDEQILYEEIKPLLDRYKIGLALFGPNEELLFDSDFISGKTDSIMNRYSFSTMLYDEVHRAELLIRYDSKAPFDTISNLMKRLFLSILLGLIVLISLIILLTWYISRTVLHPLSRIYKATEEMREGNLDYKVEYSKQDEIGRFIENFNLMRQHLMDSIAKQQYLENSRKELIGSISHDLRTPLASIQGYVEGLQDGVAEDEGMRKRYLSVILSKTKQLDRMIGDLFEFSKLDMNQLPMDMQIVNSSVVFGEIAIEAMMEAKNRGIEFLAESDLPSVSLNMDIQRIQQVISNLLDNSIKYGATTIELLIEQKERVLEVSIIDNGKGISENDLPYVFNQFYRGEKSRSRQHGGSGLGLAISRSVIEAHHGEIWANSKENLGCVITFTLPLY